MIDAIVTPEFAYRMFRDILRVRMVEERLRDLYPEAEMRCPTHFSIGQEAVAVGVCSQLERDEVVTSAHRSHAHYLAKGGDLKSMIAELYGKRTGCASGKGGSMHLIDQAVGFVGAVPIVGSTIAIGTGVAFASVLRGVPKIAVIFFGDAAVETGVFHESMNFAVLHKLPVVMICENNLYSVLSPLSVRQPGGRPISALADGHGIANWRGDGNDLDVVYKLGSKALAHARAGNGPAFLEFETYRWFEHCGPLDDEQLGYRPAGELEAWKARDPVSQYAERLKSREILDETKISIMRTEISDEIDEAVRFAKASPFPSRDELATHLFAP